MHISNDVVHRVLSALGSWMEMGSDTFKCTRDMSNCILTNKLQHDVALPCTLTLPDGLNREEVCIKITSSTYSYI